jgi:hypothetical protein
MHVPLRERAGTRTPLLLWSACQLFDHCLYALASSELAGAHGCL